MSEPPKTNRAWIEIFYRDLQELVDTTFPKICPMCGKVYADKRSFLTETIPVRDRTLEDHSGLFSLEGVREQAAIGLFRNCTCGTTIMADFRDRRDYSHAGQARRERFAALMVMLVEKGMPPTDARLELLKVLRGEASARIDELLGEIALD